MEGVGQIFNSIVDNGDELLEIFFSNLDEHQTFWSDPNNDVATIFSKISNLLASVNTKDRGLRVLCHLLPHCPLEIIEEKGQHYINVCAKICNNRGHVQSVPLAYAVLEQLIQKSLSSNELHKLLVSNIPKLLEPIAPNLDPSVLYASLSFLELAMQHYAGVCGSVKSRIEQFLYSLVDATDQHIVNCTARSLLLLQQIRGGGQHGNLHKKTWEEYYRRLVDTIHDSLNKVFAHTPETFDEEENLECLKFPSIAPTNNPIRAAQLQAVRTSNLITFLEQAIVGAYPVPKPIAPFKALNLILRGLSVSCDAMGRNPIVENVTFGTFLPTIHYALLEVLDGLVLALGTNLLMFGDMIYEIFPKCLLTTQADRCDAAKGVRKSFTRLRTKVYESIQLWCEKMRYGSCIDTVNEPILEHIVRDITPHVNEVTLKMDAGSKQRLSVKAKKKLQMEQNAATALNQAHSGGSFILGNKEQLVDSGNAKLCKAALDCLTVMLQSTGCFIKPVTHKLLQEKIVPVCFSLMSQHQVTGLYGDENVRVALLRAFAALIVNPHHHCPPPLQYAAYIFNTLQTSDKSASVRFTAAELARTAELMLHPWKETLYFPVDQAAIKDVLANKAKHPLAKLVAQKPASKAETSEKSGVESDFPAEAENLSPDTPSPKKPAIIDIPDDSDGEINESLAVTEGSDESFIEEPSTAGAEQIGWVEHVSTSSVDLSVKTAANNGKIVHNCTEDFDNGVIQHTEEDESPIEPLVVSLLDSDEEVILQEEKDDDNEDDVVEVPLPSDIKEKKSEGKNHHTSPSADEGRNVVSPKRVKLSESDDGNISDKPKTIDAIVDAMVAEFVDEP